jgi:hypothetical protein
MSRPITIALTSEQLGTLRLALLGWSARCEREAELMEKWATEERDPKQADKCRRNAAASRQFKDEADALLKVLP